METYDLSILGLLLICLLPIILVNIVEPCKGTAGVIGGPVSDARDENFLFRLDRTHVNSVEAIPSFVAPAILAMMALMVGGGPGLLAFLVWAFLVVRAVYCVVYLRGGAPAKGGNLHVLGSLTASALIVAVAVAALLRLDALNNEVENRTKAKKTGRDTALAAE